MKKILLVLAPLALAACSVLPISINLIPYLGDQKKGSFTQSMPQGKMGFDLRVPKPEGEAVDFRDQNLPVNIKGMNVEYAANLSYSGDTELNGTVTVQPYLAPWGSDELWQDKYKLGELRTLVLNKGQTALVLTGRANLTAEQVGAVNQKQARVGLIVVGEGTSTKASEITLNYDITDLTIRVSLF